MSTYLRRTKRFQNDPDRKPVTKNPGLVLHSPASEHLHRRPKAEVMPVVMAPHNPLPAGLLTQMAPDEWVAFGVGPVEQVAIRGGIVYLNDGEHITATVKQDAPVPNLQDLLRLLLRALPAEDRQLLLEELNDNSAEAQPA